MTRQDLCIQRQSAALANAVIISGALVGARELIVELGGEPEALATAAGLPLRVFDEPDIYVRAAQVVDFLELAATTGHCPDFGLRQARRLPLGILGQGWMIMRAAATIGEALRDFSQLYGLYTDAGSLRCEGRRDGAWMVYDFLPVGRWGERQIVYLTLGCICLFVSASRGHAWRSPRVQLRDQALPRAFGEFFGSGLQCGAERDAVLVDHDTLAAPMGSGHVRRLVHRALSGQAASRGLAVTAQVKAVLSMLLRHDHCSIEALGDALSLSPRTLQRRLMEAGTSYRAVVDEVRADLAWRHVTRTDLSFALVANLLGYDNQAAFSRAFRRWYGRNPRAARQTPLAEDGV
jgi:AraC-like DNA-binding protein